MGSVVENTVRISTVSSSPPRFLVITIQGFLGNQALRQMVRTARVGKTRRYHSQISIFVRAQTTTGKIDISLPYDAVRSVRSLYQYPVQTLLEKIHVRMVWGKTAQKRLTDCRTNNLNRTLSPLSVKPLLLSIGYVCVIHAGSNSAFTFFLHASRDRLRVLSSVRENAR